MKLVRARGTSGGIRIDTRVFPKPDYGLETAFLPNQVELEIQQYPGHHESLCVSVNDIVEEGQLIARAKGHGSLNLHSSIPGRVIRINYSHAGTNASQSLARSVIIELGGYFSRLGRSGEHYPWERMGRQEILRLLAERGVFFPERDRRQQNGAPNRALIISSIDTDPYSSCEGAYMAAFPKELALGAQILIRAFACRRLVLCYARVQREIVGNFFKNLDGNEGFELSAIETMDRYPQANDKLLLSMIRKSMGRNKALGDLIRVAPSDLYAAHGAIVRNSPLIERIISVSGSAIRHPRNLKVRVGMRIGDIVEECGGFQEKPALILANGVMKGFLVGLDNSITKSFFSISALCAHEVHRARRQDCIRCNRCVRVCPQGLHPELMYKALAMPEERDRFLGHYARCVSCGLCSYICPSRLPLSSAFKPYSMEPHNGKE